MTEQSSNHEIIVNYSPEWDQDQETNPIARLLESNEAIANIRAEARETYEEGPNEVYCPDGRKSKSAVTIYPKFKENNSLTSVSPEDFKYVGIGLLGGTLPDNKSFSRYLVDRSQKASELRVASHYPICGFLGLVGQLNEDAEKTLSYAEEHNFGATARWGKRYGKDSDPGRHAIKNGRRGARIIERDGGKPVPTISMSFHHVDQLFKFLEIRLPLRNGGFELRSIAKLENLEQWQWDGQTELPFNLLTEELQEFYKQNLANYKELQKIARSAKFHEGQSFRRISISDDDISIRAQLGPEVFAPDSVFNSTIPVHTDASLEEFQEALTPALAGATYGVAHAKPETDVIIIARNKHRALLAAQHMLRLPAMKNFMRQPDNRSFSVFTHNSEGRFINSLLVKPPGKAIENIQLPY